MIGAGSLSRAAWAVMASGSPHGSRRVVEFGVMLTDAGQNRTALRAEVNRPAPPTLQLQQRPALQDVRGGIQHSGGLPSASRSRRRPASARSALDACHFCAGHQASQLNEELP